MPFPFFLSPAHALNPALAFFIFPFDFFFLPFSFCLFLFRVIPCVPWSPSFHVFRVLRGFSIGVDFLSGL
ncbi:MAG: hypothetical protein D6679_11900 [Candidatus Hydrogenedentota bacterium]|nr:MAG: hypothetical protein D6679_11900 [Candidatus Hydrogenedentota bacterium]